jgi:hypothetical protein
MIIYKYIELEDKIVNGWLMEMSQDKSFKPISISTFGAGVTSGWTGGHIVIILYKINSKGGLKK